MDYSKLNLDRDALLTSIAYNLAESPTTQAYNSVAAQNNPDWAGFVGGIHRQGDIDRAGFNLGLQALVANNAAKEARAKEQRGYDQQIALLDKQHKNALALANLKRNWILEDRNNLLSEDLPEYERMNYATDFTGYIDPKQKEFVDNYNKQLDLYENETNYQKKLALSKAIDKIQKQNRVTSMINTPENVGGFFDRLGTRLFGTKQQKQGLDSFFNNTNRIQSSLLGKKVLNPYDKNKDSIYNVTKNTENYRRDNQLGLVGWNDNDKTVAIAQKLVESPEARELFGTNLLNRFQLLDDPTNFGMNKTHIVDKKSGTIYKIFIDGSGTLQIFDPFE